MNVNSAEIIQKFENKLENMTVEDIKKAQEKFDSMSDEMFELPDGMVLLDGTIYRGDTMPMSEWQQGAKYMRDNIICTLIGLQNGNTTNMDGDVYKTLQMVLEIIEDHHGEYAQPVK